VSPWPLTTACARRERDIRTLDRATRSGRTSAASRTEMLRRTSAIPPRPSERPGYTCGATGAAVASRARRSSAVNPCARAA
jgi:erythromycin esterase-like protein